MNIDRLLKLADYFESRNAQAIEAGYGSCNFADMQSWVGNPVGFIEYAIPDEGFRLVPDGNGMLYAFDSGSDTVAWVAVANFLGIAVYEAQQLFSYYYYNPQPGMTEVAERIREFVKASPGA